MSEENKLEETARAPVRVIKAKKSMPYEDFKIYLHPVSISDKGDEIIIQRPDMLGCQIDGIHPYGSYGKFIIDKKDSIIKVWTLVADKEHPDYIITGALTFEK